MLSCGLMAGAFVFLTGGGLLVVRGRRYGTGSTFDLRPRVEDASVLWGAHVVCIKDGLIYDVLLPAPVAEEGYMERAFANAEELNIAPLGGDWANDFYLREAGLSRLLHDTAG